MTSAASPRHSAQKASVRARWAAYDVVPARSVSSRARISACRASAWRPRAADCQASVSTALATSTA